MTDNYIEGKTFEKQDFTQTPLAKGEYEKCTFISCNFSEIDLSAINFSLCEFRSCNLSMVKLPKTTLREVKFKDCKQLGVLFEKCNEFLFSIHLENCLLDHSSFFKLSLKKMKFKNCSLQEVDFSEADLSAAVFENCDLKGATFDKSILERADFRTARNYSFDPEANSIRKAKFSLEGVPGLLNKYGIDIEN